MRVRPYSALLSLCAALASAAHGTESNVWPFRVEQTGGTEKNESWTTLGPLAFHQKTSGPEDVQDISGIRPFFVKRKTLSSGNRELYVLYPLFLYRSWRDAYRWSIFELINFQSPLTSPDVRGAEDRGLDLWPFYFSRDTGDGNTTYHALFPLYGSVVHRFGEDRMSWVLFPLYGRFEKRGVTTTTAPWPFVKIMSGQGNHGFEIWPLFGRREKAGAYRERFYLWPFFFENKAALWEARPHTTLAVLPFYLREREADAISETYLWPFFGYTDRSAPYRYHEIRYLWPIFVQARGDDRFINRWGPFYTRSVIKGNATTWVIWPLWRQQRWVDAEIQHTKQQFFYFIYRSEEQRAVGNPAAAPARKFHLWPLLSFWDNGAGRRQIQALSPLELFFPANDAIRLSYSPFFALYRYDRKSPHDVRQSWLWDFVTYHHQSDQTEFHLGPFLSRQTDTRKQCISLGCGILGWELVAGRRGWRFFAFDFKHRAASAANSPR